MRFLVLLFLALFVLFPAQAHPGGGLDSDKCHVCRDDCQSWGLSEDELHCHYVSGAYSSIEGQYFDIEGNPTSDPMEGFDMSSFQEPEEIPEIEDRKVLSGPDPELGAFPIDVEIGPEQPPGTLENTEELIQNNIEKESKKENIENKEGTRIDSFINNESAAKVIDNIVEKTKQAPSFVWIAPFLVLLIVVLGIFLIKKYKQLD